MVFQVIWFVLWSVLWAVYFALGGIDLGAGMLQPFVGKNDVEKKAVIGTFGPFWNGNEVWLLTAGGATFAAFPTTYALMFSYLYLPLLLILFALIIRGIAVEFREKVQGTSWKKLWDVCLFIGSLLPALLFGVAFGNIFQGLPMDGAGYHGNLFTLLNPYGILTGLVFVVVFLMHGSIWLSIKTEGEISDRTASLAGKLWYFLLVLAVAFLGYTYFATDLYANYLAYPALFVVPLLAVVCLLGVKIFLAKKNALMAMYSSVLTIILVVGIGVIGLFPNLIPSSLDPAFSLTAFNSSSSRLTLIVMTIVAAICVPIAIGYQLWAFFVFRKKRTVKQLANEMENY